MLKFIHSFTHSKKMHAGCYASPMHDDLFNIYISSLHIALSRICRESPIKSTFQQTPNQHKNIYRALDVYVLLYGSESWSTTLADRRRYRRDILNEIIDTIICLCFYLVLLFC